MLGIALPTLYRYINRGDLVAYRFGRVIRIKTVDMDQFIESSRIEPGSMGHLPPQRRDDAV
jgi:excisionase family DNA binding protein